MIGSALRGLSPGDFISEHCARRGINIKAAGFAPLREDLRVNYRAKNNMTLYLQVAFQLLGYFAPLAISGRKVGGVNHDPADLAVVLRSVPRDADNPRRLGCCYFR